jgi:hypothetical protein
MNGYKSNSIATNALSFFITKRSSAKLILVVAFDVIEVRQP